MRLIAYKVGDTTTWYPVDNVDQDHIMARVEPDSGVWGVYIGRKQRCRFITREAAEHDAENRMEAAGHKIVSRRNHRRMAALAAVAATVMSLVAALAAWWAA